MRSGPAEARPGNPISKNALSDFRFTNWRDERSARRLRSMSEEKPHLTRDEVRKRLRDKGRDGDDAKNAAIDDARIDAMVRKSIEDHGA
jgi:hypothetical protein